MSRSDGQKKGERAGLPLSSAVLTREVTVSIRANEEEEKEEVNLDMLSWP